MTTVLKDYPCEAIIASPDTGAILLQIVYTQPLPKGIKLDPVRVGAKVIVLAMQYSAQSGDWYRIQELDGSMLGWVHSINLIFSDKCPL